MLVFGDLAGQLLLVAFGAVLVIFALFEVAHQDFLVAGCAVGVGLHAADQLAAGKGERGQHKCEAREHGDKNRQRGNHLAVVALHVPLIDKRSGVVAYTPHFNTP